MCSFGNESHESTGSTGAPPTSCSLDLPTAAEGGVSRQRDPHSWPQSPGCQSGQLSAAIPEGRSQVSSWDKEYECVLEIMEGWVGIHGN